MILVIAGAGASFDSIATRPFVKTELRHQTVARLGAKLTNARPPLADELFNDRPKFQEAQREYPTVMQVATDLFKRKGKRSVEDVLADFQKEIATYRGPREAPDGGPFLYPARHQGLRI